MGALQSLLPPSNGFLPWWLLLTSILAVGNSVQAYSTLHYTRRLYPGTFVPNPQLSRSDKATPRRANGQDPEDSIKKLIPSPANAVHGVNGVVDQVTPLAGRCFGTYTFAVSVVRIYAAYNLHIGTVYDLAIWTYIIALAHFGGELLVFKTIPSVGLPQFFPLTIASFALVWLPVVRCYYVDA